jgi:hypothetical protein
MGGGASVDNKLTPFEKEFYSIFVDKHLAEGQEFLSQPTNSSARKAFVEFIKNGGWMDKLIPFEHWMVPVPETFGSDDAPSVWTKFGYVDPSDDVEDPTVVQQHGSGSGVALMGEVNGTITACSSPSGKLALASEKTFTYREVNSNKHNIQEFYSAIGDWSLFSKISELRAILLVTMYPLYLQSDEYKHWEEESSKKKTAHLSAPSHGTASSSASFEGRAHPAMLHTLSSLRDSFRKSPTETEHNGVPGSRSERLRELFIGAAATFDASDLESYLECPDTSWINEFKQAITSLPLSVAVAKVDREHRAAPIVFSSTSSLMTVVSPSPSMTPPVVGSPRVSSPPTLHASSKRRHSCGNKAFKVGQDLVTSLQNIAPSHRHAEIVEAVHGLGKSFKFGSTKQSGAVQLYGTAPVFNESGDVSYVVLVETLANVLASAAPGSGTPASPKVTRKSFALGGGGVPRAASSSPPGSHRYSHASSLACSSRDSAGPVGATSGGVSVGVSGSGGSGGGGGGGVLSAVGEGEGGETSPHNSSPTAAAASALVAAGAAAAETMGAFFSAPPNEGTMVSDIHFQQVEDLLALLPMLIVGKK